MKDLLDEIGGLLERRDLNIALDLLRRRRKQWEDRVRRVERKKAAKKIAKVMGEYKAGTLKSSSGDKVTSRKQAVAIALNTARTAAMKAGKPSKGPAPRAKK